MANPLGTFSIAAQDISSVVTLAGLWNNSSGVDVTIKVFVDLTNLDNANISTIQGRLFYGVAVGRREGMILSTTQLAASDTRAGLVLEMYIPDANSVSLQLLSDQAADDNVTVRANIVDSQLSSDLLLVGGETPTQINASAGVVESNIKQVNDTAVPETSGTLHVLDDAGDTLANETKQDAAKVVLDAIDTLTEAAGDGDLASVKTTVEAGATTAALVTHDGKLDTVGNTVDAILEDTGTTLPATLATAAALATHDGKLDTVGGNVDLILEDTGTTLPAILATLSTAAALAAAQASLDAIVALIESGGAGDLELALKIKEADTSLVTDTGGWYIKWLEKGTATEIMRKLIKDNDGNAVTAAGVVVGGNIHTASP